MGGVPVALAGDAGGIASLQEHLGQVTTGLVNVSGRANMAPQEHLTFRDMAWLP